MLQSRFVINANLLFVAFIWGIGFVPQKLGMDYWSPALFNAIRFSLGAITLLPIIWFVYRPSTKSVNNHAHTQNSKLGSTVVLGALLGAMLFLAALFQQIAIIHTSLANVAFITGLYVIIVPMIGFFLGLRYSAIVWFGGFIAVAGLYLMTGGGQSDSFKGDVVALIGAVAWALHLLILSRKAGEHEQFLLSTFQFIFCAIFSLIYALCFESVTLPSQTIAYLWPLVNGVIVVGVAYTLQVMVMDNAEPFEASLILSLEAVFGALAGFWIFDESFTAAAFLGAVFMLAGCVLAQLPSKGKR